MTRWLRLPSASHVLVSACGVAVLFFMVAPLVVLVVQSFGNSTNFNLNLSGLTLRWYGDFLTDGQLDAALATSLELTSTVTVVSLLLGVTAALAFSHLEFRGKRLLELVVFLPGIMPWLLLGISMNIFLGFLLPDATDLLPAVLGQVTIFMPFAFFIALMGARGIDPHLELAAVDLGASIWTVLRRVTLPLIVPWVIGSALIIYSLSFNELIVTSLLLNRGSTLPIFVYSALQVGLTPEINAVAGVLVISTAVLGLAAVWVIAARDRSIRARHAARREERVVPAMTQYTREAAR